jgi:hypothetical protein
VDANVIGRLAIARCLKSGDRRRIIHRWRPAALPAPAFLHPIWP